MKMSGFDSFLLVDELQLHIDDVDVVLIDLFLMLQYLLTGAKLAKLQLHLLLPRQFLQLIRLQLHLLQLLVK